jgi:hypothetical protein
MNKEQLANLEGKSEAELTDILRQAKTDKDYQLQLDVCLALLPFQDRPSLALNAIKELENLLSKAQSPEEN